MQLYERLLGTSFARLPAALRRFHGRAGGRADFALEVTHEPGFLRNAVARILRMPAAAARAPGTLVVTVQGDREVWVRTFPDMTRRTTQWIDAGRLVEQAGAMQFLFAVDAGERGMRFAQTGCRVFGRPLPRALAPRIETVVRGDDVGWNVLVSIAVPLLGRIATYGGPVTPQP
ncbi:MAG: hypothetical protein QOF71_1976 [Candidatus Eremiobacteraeota bacterium]|jgi:hypothetical protein|nr:hypothetical protein [Candidatus Eremiobacteraeota bacterium]